MGAGGSCGTCGAELNPPPLVPPPVGGTRLVLTPGECLEPSSNRETDAVTALKRGLKEYLEQIYLNVAGAQVRYQAVLDAWAEPESVATFPSAIVQPIGAATYDASSFSPNVQSKNKLPDGNYLVKYSEVAVQLTIESHCSSPEERVAVTMMLEDALNPVDWMYGFKLDLPHYFNQRAHFEPVTGTMDDSADQAVRRLRPGIVTLNANVSVMRILCRPGLRPVVRLTVEQG